MDIFSFSWQIPTSPSHFHLLCGGYIRHSIPSTLHNNIKNLCVHYLNDNDTLNEIKNAKPGTSFTSPIFLHDEVFCKWRLFFYPQGTDENTNGDPVIYLVLISLSPIISMINCQCNIYIPEIFNYSVNNIRCSFSQYSQFYDLTQNGASIGDSWKDLKKLTFNITINHINIEYNDTQTLPIDNKLSTKHITDIFKCTVNTKTSISHSVLFKMHSLSWCLQLLDDTDPNRDGSLIRIEILTLPPNCSGYFYYNLISKDIGCKTHDHILFKGWSLKKKIRDNALLKKNICNLECITINLMITLIDIFDKNGNNLTNRYIDNQKPAQKITFPPSSHYKWKIPALSANDALLLCNGYIREKCMNIYVPFDISQLIMLFFDDGKYTVDQVKNAKNSVGFKSNIFRIEGIKFYLDFFPRGYDFDITASETVEAYLNMVSVSANISNIICWYKWRICEVDVFNEDSFRFNCSAIATNASGNILTVQDIQNIDSLTFELDLFILAVFDQKGFPVNDYRKYQDTNILSTYIDNFEWRIDKKTMMNDNNVINVISDTFNMHSLEWNLELVKDENDSDLWVKLKLIALPSNIRVWVNMTLKCDDTDYMEQTEGIEFWNDNMEDTTPLIETFDRNRDITFKLVIELTDVYDENGYCITDEYSESNHLKGYR